MTDTIDFVFRLPRDTKIFPPMAGYYLAPIYSGEAQIVLLDLRYVTVVPPVEPPPVPDPTPTPPEIEIYVVKAATLNVRQSPALTAGIVDRLRFGDELHLVVGVEETTDDIHWRKLENGNWTAIQRGSAVYAVPKEAAPGG